MAKVVGKKPKMRRKPEAPGTLRRGPAGEVVMDLIEEINDLGAPEYAVTGVASIERISIDQVRIGKYSRRKDGNQIVFYEVWGYQAWQRSLAPYQQAAEIIDRQPVPDGAEKREGRH